MSVMKAEYQKYLDKLKGVDLTPKSSTLKTNISTCVNNINNLKGSISSSTWKELGEESLSNSIIPSVQGYTNSLSENIAVLEKATGMVKELVEILENYKAACEEYDALCLEDYAYTDDNGNKQYHYSEYNSKKEDLRKKYEKLEEDTKSKINEINGLSVADIKMDLAELFGLKEVDSITPEDLVLDEGGHFVADASKGINGYIVSSIDGKKHVIFRQSQIDGWGTNCNRAAAASITSAFANNPWDAVTYADETGDGIGYSQRASDKYFSRFGLTSEVNYINGAYDKIKSSLVNNLSKGNYVMFDLDESHAKGKSGQVWSSTRHWLAILDIKKTGSGPNDYAIFVSDSGHKGSSSDYYGYGAGWYTLDEFTGRRIKNYTVVKDTRRI